MIEKNYYEILGLDFSAKQSEIRNAYINLVRKYHPDVNPGNKQAEEYMKFINRAYETLCDEELRKKYDAKILKDKKISEYKGEKSSDYRYDRKTEEKDVHDIAWKKMKGYFYGINN